MTGIKLKNDSYRSAGGGKSKLLGVPFVHDEGKLKPRLAYRLVRGSFTRKLAT